MHVAASLAIERARSRTGAYVGIIPAHRPRKAWCTPTCSPRPCCRIAARATRRLALTTLVLTWDAPARLAVCRALGYHRPIWNWSHGARLPRKATGLTRESIVTLILSGRYPLLPDHHAELLSARG